MANKGTYDKDLKSIKGCNAAMRSVYRNMRQNTASENIDVDTGKKMLESLKIVSSGIRDGEFEDRIKAIEAALRG